MLDTPAQPLLLNGVLQHYAWGGYNFLPNLLGRGNPDHLPTAELWIGTHEKGPAEVVGTSTTLAELIAAEPLATLGGDVARHFNNRLPFLFKILDVREMLSIQVHPTKAAAEEGFAREEQQGPARDAADRNYRDDNHKPELGVALSDFYLLHGFRTPRDVRFVLQTVPGWQSLVKVLDAGGVRGLYRHVMELPQGEVNELLQPLYEHLADGPAADLDEPDYWAKTAFEQYTNDGDYDRGIFSIYWFNVVHLTPGEAIFQDAGIPHAYLRGTCVEIMANSDNVLRGGLTPKHIDVPELLRNVRFEPVVPNILYPQVGDDDWDDYDVPVSDFSLGVAEKRVGDALEVTVVTGPSILFLLSGRIVETYSGITLNHRQRTMFIPAGDHRAFDVQENCVVYRAGVNAQRLDSPASGQGHHVTDT